MGAVLDPALIGLDEAKHLPAASTFCGKCESVCPMKIPLPKMMRHWRERAFERQLNPPVERSMLRLWAYMAQRPALYRLGTGIAARMMALFGRKSGKFSRLPLASGWTDARDMPAPEGDTFFSRYAREERAGRI